MQKNILINYEILISQSLKTLKATIISGFFKFLMLHKI